MTIWQWGAVVCVIVWWAWLMLDSPILKPWFGLRKPKGHQGRWFE